MLLLIAIVISTAIPSFAQTGFDLNKTIAETAVYLQKTIPDPQVGSTGGEWAVMGLARSGEERAEADDYAGTNRGVCGSWNKG